MTVALARVARMSSALRWSLPNARPSACCLVATERHMPGDKPRDPGRLVRVEIPRLGKERRELPPGQFIDEQVVALDDDQRYLPRYRDRTGDGLLDLPTELRGVDDGFGRRGKSAHEGHEARAIERVGRSFALRTPQPLELALSQVKAVHRHQDRVRVKRRHQR